MAEETKTQELSGESEKLPKEGLENQKDSQKGLEKPKASPKEELEKKVMELRQKLQILEWDAGRDQINPAKRFELEQLKKEFEDLKSQLAAEEAKEKPKKEEPEPEEPLPEEPEEEGFMEKIKDVVEKVEKALHLKKDDDDLFKDEVEADELQNESDEGLEKSETSPEEEPVEETTEEEKPEETQSNESQ
ncbi:MAG: hypothetical protein KAT77_01020 [Nanoarchaeota archaeon]|nr:hypothetical protein [Nanoarchaeota archaeon]